MRVRAEAKFEGGPVAWLAVAVWLSAGLTAWAQPVPGTQGGAGTLGLRAGEKVTAGKIQEIYRKILADWSAGETERAPDELIELEAAVVLDSDPTTRKLLLKEEQAVIHQVGAADLEVLVPIAVLHHEAYRRLLERGFHGHALAMIHTRTMARDLAILYHDQSGSEGASLVSSRLLTSLGGLLQQSAQQLPAAEMFQQAVELDPKNVAALLGLATIYEKNAQTESAVKDLRQALVVEPGNVEGRLRLALNLRRQQEHQNHRAEAAKLLTDLTAVTEPSWATPLAFQELARLDSDEGKTAEAEKVLRQALKRYPNDLRLHIQLAAVLDRRGAPGEATALVEKALNLPMGEEASARFLYNTVRPDAFAAARTFLAENSRSRLPVLAQALGAPPPSSGTGVGR
ncbi:MAG TPA: tetratricopeptide repeat protein [Thermoanaerobaculia bacterium]|jgi:Flp pilus assembly protein TadD|nr:tetratricopeptide repeat protein [Thermoanaerobaculia bacterium]